MGQLNIIKMTKIKSGKTVGEITFSSRVDLSKLLCASSEMQFKEFDLLI